MHNKLKLKQSYQDLANSNALETVLSQLESDIEKELRSTADDKLPDLKRRLLAIDALRGAIQSSVITYLETA